MIHVLVQFAVVAVVLKPPVRKSSFSSRSTATNRDRMLQGATLQQADVERAENLVALQPVLFGQVRGVCRSGYDRPHVHNLPIGLLFRLEQRGCGSVSRRADGELKIVCRSHRAINRDMREGVATDELTYGAVREGQAWVVGGNRQNLFRWQRRCV